MRLRRGFLGSVVLSSVALGVAACGGGGRAASPQPVVTETVIAPPTAGSVSPSPSTSSSLAATGVQNLFLTDGVRAQLVAAGATLHSLTPKDFTGLVAGRSYYAYDATTQTYYAAGALDPAPSSTPAQVSVQDDGSYLVFTRPASTGTWTAYDVGLAGIGGTTCPLNIPAAVAETWHWLKGGCRPPT